MQMTTCQEMPQKQELGTQFISKTCISPASNSTTTYESSPLLFFITLSPVPLNCKFIKTSQQDDDNIEPCSLQKPVNQKTNFSRFTLAKQKQCKTAQVRHKPCIYRVTYFPGERTRQDAHFAPSRSVPNSLPFFLFSAEQ